MVVLCSLGDDTNEAAGHARTVPWGDPDRQTLFLLDANANRIVAVVAAHTATAQRMRFAAPLSVVATCRQQKRNVLEFLPHAAAPGSTVVALRACCPAKLRSQLPHENVIPGRETTGTAPAEGGCLKRFSRISWACVPIDFPGAIKSNSW
jgi:hypothetical protein